LIDNRRGGGRNSKGSGVPLPRVDDFRTFLADFVSDMPQAGLAMELRLWCSEERADL